MFDPTLLQQGLPTAVIVLLSFVQPFVTALFTRPSMTSKTRQVIAVAVAAVIAVVYTLLNGGIDSWEKFFFAMPAIYTLGNIIYGLLVKEQVKAVEASKGFIDKTVVDPAAVEEAKEDVVAVGADVVPAVLPQRDDVKADVVVMDVVEESPRKG
jgi:hypothetical protein